MSESDMTGSPVHEQINAVLKKARAENKRTIAFWSSSPRFSPWEWIVPFVRSLGVGAHFPIVLSAYPLDGYCKLDIPHFVIAADQLRRLESLDCLVAATDDDEGDFPESCRVLAVAHAFMYNDSSVFLHAAGHQTKFDGYLVNCRLGNSAQQIRELWTGLLPRKMFRRKGDRFDILACGYLRSAALQENMRELRARRDAICYAPMARGLAKEQGGDRIALYAKKILRTLLTNFPDHQIIFRPAPYAEVDEDIRELSASFAAFPNFHVDTSLERLQTFARSAVLVSDVSHVLFSFAFTTLRPAISFRPWIREKSVAKAPYGALITDFTSLVTSIRQMLNEESAWSARIRAARDRVVFPPETAFSDIGLLLERFMDNAPLDDRNTWVCIPRNLEEEKDGEAHAIYKLLACDQASWQTLMTFARDIHTESSLLKAVCCLKRLEEAGDGPLDAPFWEDLARRTGKGEVKNLSDLKAYCVGIVKTAFLESLRSRNLRGMMALEKMYARYCEGGCPPA